MKSGQNRSSAVMQQRIEASDSLDDFPTQPWGTRALTKHVLTPLCLKHALSIRTCYEPTCNRGYMARPLAEFFETVRATDIFHYGWKDQQETRDYLFPESPRYEPDWTIFNPPFRLAHQFIEKAMITSRVGCAALVRTSFLEGVDRYRRLFSVAPPTVVAQFSERLPMVKGRIDAKASTATSYAWLVWVRGVQPMPFQWIPPCRRQLERPEDYP